MTDEDDEIKLTNAEMAYEDYVISLIAGKTAEQVDETKLTPEQIEKGGHYARNVWMFGRLDPEDFERNYLEEVVRNGPDAREFEAELEYRKKYGEDPPPDCSKPYADGTRQCGEYDGRDDDFIREAQKCMEDVYYADDDDVQLDPGEEIPSGETGIYTSLI